MSVFVAVAAVLKSLINIANFAFNPNATPLLTLPMVCTGDVPAASKAAVASSKSLYKSATIVATGVRSAFKTSSTDGIAL